MSTIPAALFVALALAGCTATPATTSTPGAAAATTVSPDASTEPTTGPGADAPTSPTCDTVLTAEAYSWFEAEGLQPMEPASADHIATYYPLAASMVEAGGLSCDWGRPASEGLMLVQLPDADLGVWAPALAEAGFAETGDPVPGAYAGPVDPGTGVSPIVVVTGDTLTFLNTTKLASWIAPAS